MKFFYFVRISAILMLGLFAFCCSPDSGLITSKQVFTPDVFNRTIDSTSIYGTETCFGDTLLCDPEWVCPDNNWWEPTPNYWGNYAQCGTLTSEAHADTAYGLLAAHLTWYIDLAATFSECGIPLVNGQKYRIEWSDAEYVINCNYGLVGTQGAFSGCGVFNFDLQWTQSAATPDTLELGSPLCLRTAGMWCACLAVREDYPFPTFDEPFGNVIDTTNWYHIDNFFEMNRRIIFTVQVERSEGVWIDRCTKQVTICETYHEDKELVLESL